jgi:hypothetical protein
MYTQFNEAWIMAIIYKNIFTYLMANKSFKNFQTSYILVPGILFLIHIHPCQGGRDRHQDCCAVIRDGTGYTAGRIILFYLISGIRPDTGFDLPVSGRITDTENSRISGPIEEITISIHNISKNLFFKPWIPVLILCKKC